MTISTIRRAEDYDYSNIESAAARFAARHGISLMYEGETWANAVEYQAAPRDEYDSHGKRLEKLWTACYCRALGHPHIDRRLTIYSGYVGIALD